MILIDAQEGFNSRAVTRKYSTIKYNLTGSSQRDLFQRVFIKLCETRSFLSSRCHVQSIKRTIHQEEEVVDVIQNELSTSTRQISKHIELSHGTVHRTLREQ